MYAYELLIERRVKHPDSVDIYYNIEGIRTPSAIEQNGFGKKAVLKATIKKLLPTNNAA